DEHTAPSWGKLLHEPGDFFRDNPPAQEKPVAHLTGSNFNLTDSGGPLLWEARLGMVFLKGFRYQDGALVVPESGFYYIYSKVQLASLGCPEGGRLVSLGLYMRTPRYPKELELLLGRKTLCGQRSSSHIWWDSSFLGGLVHLEAGDELIVRLRDTRHFWVRDASRSYFGAFMV
ncbi:tumor necrosis factor ligand superfamily member 14, partial [Erinaceus europaeus]|uniref:Tumor necrosis factor ligand superfamily member 14 n=1 Tax=Erinaceus europaeus TaxID=9365 RepID=A0ABM3WU92_ERIEU